MVYVCVSVDTRPPAGSCFGVNATNGNDIFHVV